MVHRKNLRGAVLIRVHMHHPAKDYWIKLTTRRIARGLGVNRSPQAELCPVRMAPVALRRYAQIGVLMPHRDTKRHTIIQLFLSRTLWHGVHRPN